MRALFTILISFYILNGIGQLAPGIYWVQFTDKDNTPYDIDHPEQFLSERAIERRLKNNIPIITEDLPVDPAYVDSLRSLGLEVLNTSKWFNGISIRSNDLGLIDILHYLSFIKEPLRNDTLSEISVQPDKLKRLFLKGSFDYGYSSRQIKMLNGHKLHEMGFKGNGVLIAIIDAGFLNADVMSSLSHLWNSDRILAVKDFVHDGQAFFNSHSHGSKVLSTVGGFIDNTLSGTACEAEFLLLRSEKGESEYLVEEYNWISAAEYADSFGVDVINSSLGYSEFDDPSQNHSYKDLDGKTTPVSLAASIAASKGIIVVNSAGNQGAEDWKYITAPGDATDILTIGAVDSSETITNFSSKGPTSDGRIKPDVCAMGRYVITQEVNDVIAMSSGTSFSSPITAGLVACLLQANPNASTSDIINAVIKSADRYQKPDTIYGYGIPDFLLANTILKNQKAEDNALTTYNLYPNPVDDAAFLEITLPWLDNSGMGDIYIYDVQGRLLQTTPWYLEPGYNITTLTIDGRLEKGYYIVVTHIKGRMYSLSLLKL